MIRHHRFLLIALLILIFIIPSCHAMDNQTGDLIESDDAQTAISTVDEDTLAANNDYYFNSSLEDDNGDGTSQNPYKYLTAERIKGNCNIHLTDGEYVLDDSKSIERVNIIGSTPTKTIIKYDGVGFTVNSFLSLTNVTLTDMSITNHGSVNATNTIFNYGYGSKADSYGNNYGGAIYTPNANANSKVTISNCTFNEGYAFYGGAIYMGAGHLSISDSQFINNCAYNFGGAIACENTLNVTVSKSKFIRDYSIDDAGGAIYVKSSPITISYCDFINCSATFGGAITALNGDVRLNHVTVLNSSAKWDGGAIYHMYGKFSSTNGYYNNNSARNGGALYIDNSSDLLLISNIFEANRANVQAGAIFSLLNNLRVSLTGNTYKNNNAQINKDYFDTSDLNANIGNGNYSNYLISNEEITDIPSRYSLVENGLTTMVKDQQSSGNCWAFTAMAVLESCLKKATGIEFDLSEENMKNLIALYSDYGWKMDTNEGGYDSMPFGYFASWLGPVNESSDVFDDKSVLSPVLNSILHIQNILLLKRDNYTDNDAIKTAILKYGAVGTSIYFDNYYLNNGKDYFTWALYPSNHAVTIVGWDDNYSRDNFYFGSYADGDGAWIVKNSWGPNWGDNGYFYVSYYDESFAKPGVEGIAYTFVLNETRKYDKNYQYDIAGKTDYLHDDRTAVWYKNKFTAEGNEILSGVSTYFEKLTNWTVSVYVNNVLKTTKSGSSQAGYYTFHLDDIVPLYAGDVFEIVFNTTSDRLSSVPISEIASLNKAIYYPEISYVSYDGVNWQDLFYLSKTYALHTYKSQVACIKAFTVLADYNTTTAISVANGSIEISVADQFNNPVKAGEVRVNLSGNVQTFNLNNGKVQVPISLVDGIYDIDVIYTGENYSSSRGSCSLEIMLNVDLAKDNVYTYNSNYRIRLSNQFGNPISGKTMILNLNNKLYNLTSNANGVITFNLRLDIGKYDFALINPSNNDNITQVIQISPRLSENQDVVMYYGSNKVFKVRIHDDNGNILKGESIKILIGGKSYTAKSDKNGFASVKLNKLVAKTYSVTVDYKGFKISNKIKIKPTLTAKNKSIKKGKVLKFTAKLVNSNGKALKGKKITFKIKNKKYAAKTNKKGIATIKIKKLKVGKYTILTSFKGIKIKNKIAVKR
ncbi:C1 family peptidase [Methanobrevibacter sp.]|uniref:C1 family peptidase n=1 Tax=Methanobrevibacter sp. TaxID=66852 RepID=UPI00386BBB4C